MRIFDTPVQLLHNGYGFCGFLLVRRLCGRYVPSHFLASCSRAFESARILTLDSGLGVLFGKLQQGVQENQQVLALARMRADAEEVYGTALAGIGPAAERIGGGFAKDEGASVRKVNILPFGWPFDTQTHYFQGV